MTRASQISFLFKRELWEHKGSVLWAPLGIAAAAVLLMLLSLSLGVDDFSRHLDQIVELTGGQRVGGDEPTQRIDFSRGEIVAAAEDLDWVLWGSQFIGIVEPTLHGIAIAFELLALIVSVFYLLAALFNDRKDRTVLFWKSLPFSETESVIIKLVVATLVIPAIALLAALLVQLVFAASTVVLLLKATDFSFSQLMAEINVLPVFFFHVGLSLVFAVKNLPLFSWFLFASAFSRKSPFLVAILPPLVIITLESMFFGSDYFADFIGSFFAGERFSFEDLNQDAPLAALLVIEPLQLLRIAVVSLPLIGASIWLRNNRFEI